MRLRDINALRAYIASWYQCTTVHADKIKTLGEQGHVGIIVACSELYISQKIGGLWSPIGNSSVSEPIPQPHNHCPEGPIHTHARN